MNKYGGIFSSFAKLLLELFVIFREILDHWILLDHLVLVLGVVALIHHLLLVLTLLEGINGLLDLALALFDFVFELVYPIILFGMFNEIGV